MNKVLFYIDDSESDLMIMQIAFQKMASKTNSLSTFTSGENFLNFLEARGNYENRNLLSGCFCILLDVNLPEMSGFDVLKLLKDSKRKELRIIPVIMFSSSRRETDIKRSQELGANLYLTKPTHYQDLENIVTDLFENFVSSDTDQPLNL